MVGENALCPLLRNPPSPASADPSFRTLRHPERGHNRGLVESGFAIPNTCTLPIAPSGTYRHVYKALDDVHLEHYSFLLSPGFFRFALSLPVQ